MPPILGQMVDEGYPVRALLKTQCLRAVRIAPEDAILGIVIYRAG